MHTRKKPGLAWERVKYTHNTCEKSSKYCTSISVPWCTYLFMFEEPLTVDFVQQICKELIKDWDTFAFALGISNARIQAIKQHNRNQISERVLMDIIVCWMKQQPMARDKVTDTNNHNPLSMERYGCLIWNAMAVLYGTLYGCLIWNAMVVLYGTLYGRLIWNAMVVLYGTLWLSFMDRCMAVLYGSLRLSYMEHYGCLIRNAIWLSYMERYGCLIWNAMAILYRSLTVHCSGLFRGSVLGQDTSEPSLVLVKPRKA